jgi:hypothetical protein
MFTTSSGFVIAIYALGVGVLLATAIGLLGALTLLLFGLV